MKLGKLKAIFGLGMTPIEGVKNGKIKSLAPKTYVQTDGLFYAEIFCLSKPMLAVCATYMYTFHTFFEAKVLLVH